MNWNQNKSILLSKCCVYLFMAAFVVICLTAPWLFTQLILLRGEPMEKLPLFLATIYTGAFPAAGALLALKKLLGNISADQVFIDQNVGLLRRLSWYCFAAAIICLVSTLFYPPFFILFSAAAFIGLVLRVVKNVFAQAIVLKNENDYTI